MHYIPQLRSKLLILVGALCLTAGVASAKDDVNQAREHYKRGTTLYDLGKYPEAIAEFQQAYEIKDDPVLLYNIAQSYRLSNSYQDALRFYRTYLRKNPKAVNRDEVEQKIADMETLLNTQNRVQNAPPSEAIPPKGDRPAVGSVSTPVEARTYTPPPPPPQQEPVPDVKPMTPEPTPPTPQPQTTETPQIQTREEHVKSNDSDRPVTDNRPGRGKVIGGVALLVVGLAAVGGGVAMGFLAKGKGDQQMSSGTFDPNLESSGKSFQLIGTILDAAGGVLALTGIIVAAVGASQNGKAEHSSAMIVPAVGPGYAGASMQLHF